jgi:DNA-binding response OmpR family regulator
MGEDVCRHSPQARFPAHDPTEVFAREFVRQGLREGGHEVDWEIDGQRGLREALAARHDLMLLDIMLPGVDGLQLLAEVRRREVKTPVLLLTALDDVDDRVRGLDRGADDYLTKPFAFSELLARIRALSRRPPLEMEPVLRVGDLELDMVRHEVRRGDRRIDLSRREFGLLEFFMRNARQLLTRSQLAERVWGFDFFHDSNVVEVYVGYLRRKLDAPGSKTRIRTVRGMGYILDIDDGD